MKPEALKVVENINFLVPFEGTNEKDLFKELYLLKYNSDGYMEWIEFLGKTIWDSDNDEREWLEEENEKEPLEPFIKKIMIYQLKFLNKQLKSLKNYKGKNEI
jgi:hypothetical protein